MKLQAFIYKIIDEKYVIFKIMGALELIKVLKII